jgi:hypothetical protein
VHVSDGVSTGSTDRGGSPVRRGASAGQRDWERQKRRAEVFGDALPDVTSDEQDPAEQVDGDSAGDRWLKSQVPPHHG